MHDQHRPSNRRRKGPATTDSGARRGLARRLTTALGLAAGLAMLAGCMSELRPMVLTTAQTRMVAPTDAFAVPLPGGPAVLSVTETRYANALEQMIILANSSRRPGQNFIRIQFFGETPARMADHATLDNDLLDMGAIWEEIDTALPGVGMTVSPYFVRNRYGSFGYAIGRYSNDLCLYAWQRIGAASSDLEKDSTAPAIGLRFRYCKTNASEAQLLDLVYGFTINAYFDSADWMPFSTPITVITRDPVQPPGLVLPVPAPATTSSTSSAPRTTTTTTTNTTPAPQPVILTPSGPTVPLPGGGVPPPSGTTTTTSSGYGPVVPPPPG